MNIRDLQEELIEAAEKVAIQCSQANIDRLTAVRVMLTETEAMEDAKFVREARDPSARSIARAIEEVEHSVRLAKISLRRGNMSDLAYHMGEAARLSKLVSRRDPKLSTIDL